MLFSDCCDLASFPSKMKRSHSESETDDVGYSGDEKDDDNCSGGGVTRKRRRGIIEKRRRDRINNSLAELRRLVPAAFEKQGSAKLEKAEILQMTVDHLKMLHTKGMDALAYDPNKFAMDYHNIGFRECAAEVARYMVTVEGMDIQDPLRLRLMSHLQCYAAQRELANKQAATSWGWASTPAAPTAQPPASYSPSVTSFNGQMAPPTVPHGPPSHHPVPSIGLDQSHGMSAFSAPTSNEGPSQGPSSLQLYVPRIPTTATAAPPVPAVSMATASSQPLSNYHLNLNAHTFSPSHSGNIGLSSNANGLNGSYNTSLQGPGGGVKPYRPWGAEIAY